jgi:hypothetical protein
MAIFSLPIAEPRRTTRTCGECQACCSYFPLLPNPGFWPEGKPAQEPCRYLCSKGCSIHDEPRPDVCTGFRCAYLMGNVPWRPDEVGVIFCGVPKEFATQLQLSAKCFPDPDDGIMLVEGRPNAMLDLDSAKVRYYLGKNWKWWKYILVLPHGPDIHNHHGNGRIRMFPGLLVFWDESPAYAEQLHEWWQRT